MAATGIRKRWLAALAACGALLAVALWLNREDPPRAPSQIDAPEQLVVIERREADAPDAEAAARDSAGKSRRKRSGRIDARDAERVGGSVRDRQGNPLEGALVNLRARRGPLSASLGAAFTDRSGAFSFELSSWSSEFALRRALRRSPEPDEGASPSSIDALETYGQVSLEIAAALDGYAPSSLQCSLIELRRRPDELRLQLDDGVELGGYVTRNSSDSNRRVAGASISLLDGQGAVAASTTADASARFVLRVPPGRYDLFVRHEVFGTAFLSDLDLTHDEPQWPLAIELRSAARIGGSVLHADGTPVSNLVLQATHSTLLARDPSDLSIHEQAELEGPAGLARALAVTDAEGRFSFRSLREGRFELHAPGTDEALLRGSRTVFSDSPAVTFTFRGQRLRVDVSDFGLENALDAQLECWRIERRFEPAPERELTPLGDGRGTFHLDVQPGERLYLRAFAGGSPFAWTILDVDSGEGERRVALRIGDGSATPSDGAPGLDYVLGVRVELEVLDEDGKPLTGWRAAAISAQGDVPAGWSGFRPGADGALPALPPGRFRLSLMPTRRDSFHCFTSVGSELEAELGSSQAVTFRVPLGGRLRLRMPTEARDIDAWRSTDVWKDLAERGWGVEALPLDGAGEPVELLLVDSVQANYAGFSALPGWDVEASPALLPGRYRLRITRPDSSPRVTEVTVRAGEITTVAP